MEKITYKAFGRKSDLYIGKNWEEINSLIPEVQTVIITDSNISKHYSDNFPECKILTLSPGENTKSMSTIGQIIKELLKLELDRSGFLVGIGGGVIGDITGFVASVYMRGIRFGLVSSSLLSQVDASIGGKNGVNCAGYKNVIGCFTQPEFVLCDTRMLTSLPAEDFRSGLAEIVKHALISDIRLFEYLEYNCSNIMADNREIMDELVLRSAKIKIEIVEKDEKEKGERRLLNFGHTLGHAIESNNRIKHGLAVAQGMYFSCLMSMEEGKLTKDQFSRITSLLKSLELISAEPVMQRTYIEMVRRDKKRERQIMHFVLLQDIGRAYIKELAMMDLITWMENKI